MDENNNVQSNNQVNNQPIPIKDNQTNIDSQTPSINVNDNTNNIGIPTVVATSIDNQVLQQPINQMSQQQAKTPEPIPQTITVSEGTSNIQNSAPIPPQQEVSVNNNKETKKIEASSPMQAEKTEIDASKSTGPMIIFFILIFGFIIGLPYLTDYLNAKKQAEKDAAFEEQLKQQEEQMKQEEEKTNEQPAYKNLTCISAPQDITAETVPTNSPATSTQTYVFKYLDDNLKEYVSTTSFVYKVSDSSYELEKNNCQKQLIDSASLNVVGYEFNCSINDLLIEKTEKYNLENFKITDESGKTLEPVFKKDTKISVISDNLKKQGYTCN